MDAESGNGHIDPGHIKQIRRRLSMTQEQFGKAVGVRMLTIHRWEHGKSRPHKMFQQKIREMDADGQGQENQVEGPAEA